MAAVSIVLADAETSPVSHTFVPVGNDKDGIFWFEDQSQANAIGFWRISYQLVRPPIAQAGGNSKDRIYRVKVGLHEPVLETVSNDTVSGIAPAPTVSYISKFFGEMLMPERGSLQNRKNLRKMAHNLLNEAQFVALAETLLPPF
jgi:hypothetical protein